MSLTFISLFAGIGGMDLGLERAGLRCVAQVEIDDYAQKVLAKHWPDVARFRDVRECGAHNLPRADLICGGFPCQDISVAGRQAGLDGERSGLWFEFARILGELRPHYALVENVANLLSGERGAWMGTVLGDLAEIGYDTEWHCIPALAVGAPHIRDRVFILAYARSERRQRNSRNASGNEGTDERRAALHYYELECDGESGRTSAMAHANSDDGDRGGGSLQMGRGGGAETVTLNGDTRRVEWPTQPRMKGATDGLPAGMDGNGLIVTQRPGDSGAWHGDWERDTPRLARGVTNRRNRLRGLGNAVVPQVAEFLGHALLAYHKRVQE